MSYTPVIDPATRDFIRRHLTDDVSSLALRRQGTEGVDMSVALTQIAGWQRARTKLPRLAALDGIIYPPHLSLEQCSGEATSCSCRAVSRSMFRQRAETSFSHP